MTDAFMVCCRTMLSAKALSLWAPVVLILSISVACAGCVGAPGEDPCVSDTEDENSPCIANCGEGTQRENGVCVLRCGPTEYPKDGLCVSKCTDGTVMRNGICVTESADDVNHGGISPDAGQSEREPDIGRMDTADVMGGHDDVEPEVLSDFVKADSDGAGPGPNPDIDTGPPPEKTLEGTYVITNSLDADALEGVTKITGNLIVLAQGLTSLKLGTLKEVDGFVTITDNAALESFTFSALSRIGKYLYVYDNDALKSCFLPMLETVGGDLWMNSNAMLLSFRFPALLDVSGHFRVFSSASLTSFELPELTSVGTGMAVESNNALTSFELPSLIHVGGLFEMHHNHLLPQCLVDALVIQLEGSQGLTGAIITDYNLSDCVCHEVNGVMEVVCI